MADYWETFDSDPMVSMPAYHVSCRYCGVDLWGRSGEHKPDCPRHEPEIGPEIEQTVPAV